VPAGQFWIGRRDAHIAGGGRDGLHVGHLDPVVQFLVQGFGEAVEVLSVIALALLIGGGTHGWLVAIPLVAYGLGLGLASAQLTGTVLSDVPVHESRQGSATQSTLRQFGSALGTAFAGAALSMALTFTLPSALHAAGITGHSADSIASATRESAGTTITRLRIKGAGSPLGTHTPAAVDALAGDSPMPPDGRCSSPPHSWCSA
jgi:hypothetical protein